MPPLASCHETFVHIAAVDSISNARSKACRALSAFLISTYAEPRYRKQLVSDTLRFIQGLAARSDRPLNQFAVDHLVEILRHRRALDEQSGRDYSLAMHLIRQRTTVAARTKAFRFSAPFPQLAGPMVARPRNHIIPGLRPRTPYTSSLARRFVASLRSRGALRFARALCTPGSPLHLAYTVTLARGFVASLPRPGLPRRSGVSLGKAGWRASLRSRAPSSSASPSDPLHVLPLDERRVTVRSRAPSGLDVSVTQQP